MDLDSNIPTPNALIRHVLTYTLRQIKTNERHVNTKQIAAICGPHVDIESGALKTHPILAAVGYDGKKSGDRAGGEA